MATLLTSTKKNSIGKSLHEPFVEHAREHNLRQTTHGRNRAPKPVSVTARGRPGVLRSFLLPDAFLQPWQRPNGERELTRLVAVDGVFFVGAGAPTVVAADAVDFVVDVHHVEGAAG